MKKKIKIDYRLVFVLLFCIVSTTVVIWGIDNKDIEVEDNIFSFYRGSEDPLPLKSDVYIVNVSSLSDEGITNKEKTEIENQQIKELQYLIKKSFKDAKGVFVLAPEILNQPVVERSKFLQDFRNAGNVFWHYNIKNIGYYHPNDNCCQIKYVDDSYGGDRRFEIYGSGKYDKNYMPYFMMTMNGEKVKYDEQGHVYSITDKSGVNKKLYAMEDGTVYVHEVSQSQVSTYDLDKLYHIVTKKDSKADFTDAVIFIQNDKHTYSYNEDIGSTSQTLAEYYINALGTIENTKSMPVLSKNQKLIFVLIVELIVALFAIFAPQLVGIFAYVLIAASALFAKVFLYQTSICNLPIFVMEIAIFVTFLLITVFKWVLTRINVRNLPIDAVIRFTNTIVNLDNSVSYSEYLMKNRGEIEEDISASLLLPVMDKDSFLLKELAEENHRNHRFVDKEFWHADQESESSVIQVRTNLFQGVRYVAFIPLPVFDVETENVTYTVIGLNKKLKSQNASYISMMLFSMYIYFKAQHERGEHQRMYFAMLSLMISVIDAKDPVTAGHSQRVASISKDIGIWLNLSKNEQVDLEFTALLHDIGKIGVSDYVLNKPSVYTQNDFEQMKYHTIRGAELLEEAKISEEIIDGVRHHHERVDGKGYPDGLTGDELSLFAKIIKIADVYDALTSNRQYKEKWATDRALNIIYRGRGTEFDQEIADVFIEHMRPEGWVPPVDENQNKERKDPNAEKAVRIVKDFYYRYKEYIRPDYQLPSSAIDSIDFGFGLGFMGYDWGETFNNDKFLEDKPMILSYEKDSKSLFFGQKSAAKEVDSIFYYFFKGFVNMGVYLLEPSWEKEVHDMLEEKYGLPQVVDNTISIYIARKMRIVSYRSSNDSTLLFYISDYMCTNYLYNEQKK